MDKFEEMLGQSLDDMVDEEMEIRERESYNKALEDFEKALEKHQQDNWIDNLEYGITFDDVEEVIKQLKK